MKTLIFPKIGLRNIKTALSVFSCMIIFQLFSLGNPFYACVSAVICMKDTVENSVTMGKTRLLGTFIGGIIGTIFVYTLAFFPNAPKYNSLLTSIGIIITIYLCTLTKKPDTVTIACIVFIGIMLNYTGSESYYYALSRTATTAVGVIIAIIINKYINLPPNINT